LNTSPQKVEITQAKQQCIDRYNGLQDFYLRLSFPDPKSADHYDTIMREHRYCPISKKDEWPTKIGIFEVYVNKEKAEKKEAKEGEYFKAGYIECEWKEDNINITGLWFAKNAGNIPSGWVLPSKQISGTGLNSLNSLLCLFDHFRELDKHIKYFSLCDQSKAYKKPSVKTSNKDSDSTSNSDKTSTYEDSKGIYQKIGFELCTDSSGSFSKDKPVSSNYKRERGWILQSSLNA
jgi:hypothetical protein